MIDVPETFSDSWYRVSPQKIALRPQVEAHRQWYRGQQWIVLQDPFNATFFRLRPEAYDFVARLRTSRSVAEVWQGCMERDPDRAPGQQEVVRLLGQLYQANLLHYSTPADSASLFKRYKERREREVRQSLLQIMFARIPLLDPDDFLKRFMPLARLLISPLGALIWIAVVALGVKTCVDNAGALVDQSEGLLAPGNWLLLYLAMVVLKVIHEYGHAFACRRFGGEVHVMGVMLLVFTPIPYVDASSAWAFRSRWQRLFVGAAGMIVEIFVAATAAIVWANTGPGTVHALCYNMMIIASISTVIFNINPLLRFDGYYMLSDLLDMPNLHGQSRAHLVYLVERYCFGVRKPKPVAEDWQEATIYLVFGILSQIYRIVVFGGILLFIADKFLIAGLILAVVCVVSWIGAPAWKFFRYLSTSPKLDRSRRRAVLVVIFGVAGLIAAFGVIPAPYGVRAPGVVAAKEYAVVSNETAGVLTRVVIESGTAVRAGEVLAELADPELAFEMQRNSGLLAEAKQLELASLRDGAVDLDPIRKQIEALADQRQQLVERENGLTVRAPFDGVWIAARLDEMVGRQLARGTGIGELVAPADWRFIATVSQSDAKYLFESDVESVGVRLNGQAATIVPVVEHHVVAAEQMVLPSASLGWLAGGSVAVDQTRGDGMRAKESYYKVIAELDGQEASVLHHGHTGEVRFALPPKPILYQVVTAVRQLLQRRYAL